MSGAATSVELTANSLYEAAALSLAMFRKGWVDRTSRSGHGARGARQPARDQTRRDDRAGAPMARGRDVGPGEVLKKRKVKKLLNP